MSRRCLVIGGTRGIGAALVGALHARGDSVWASGRDADSIAAAAVRAPGVHWTALDLARERDPAAWLARLGGPPFDLVVLSAAVQCERDFTRTRGGDEAYSIEDEIRIDLLAPILLSRALPPHLAGGATVVFITSGLALAPKRASPVYCAAKAGLRSFATALRAQWAHRGIRVVEALPPLVDTDMTRGRGTRKMAPAAVADAILRGLDAGRREIDIGATRLLRLLLRLSPALAERIMLGR